MTERNRATRRLLLQVQVARALAGSPSMDVARPLVLEHLTRALTCWLGIFWRPTPDGTALTVDAVVLTDSEDDAEFATAVRSMRLGLGEALAGRAWQTSQPAWIPDLAADASFPPLPPRQREEPRGTLAFPIISNGEVILILQVSSDDPTAPDPGTLEVLESTFQNVLQFAERREAEAAERRLAAEQAALRRVATLIAEGAEPESVFQAVTSEVGNLFDAQTANMVQYRPDGTSAVLLGGWTADVAALAPGTILEMDGEAAISQIRQTGLPVRIDDYTRLSGDLAAQVRELGARAAVAAPIMVQGYLWGAMIVISNEGPFAPGTETRIAEFTDLVALALSSTDAYSQLTASRARIVEAGDAERRRLERNLHDGAQQRLVSLSLALRLARNRLEADPRRPPRCSRRRARSSPPHSRSSGSWRGASTPPSSPTAASRPPSRLSPARSSVPVELRPSPRTACPPRSRPRRTTSSRSRSRTSPSTPAPRASTSPSCAATDGRSSRSPTTAREGPTPPADPACSAWPTASRRSRATSTSRARRAPAPRVRARIPLG